MIATLLGTLPSLRGAESLLFVSSVLVALLSIGCFAGFAWAIRGHFRPYGGMPVGMRVISLLSLVGFAWFLSGRLVVSQSSGGVEQVPKDLIADLLFILSLALFWASIGVTRGNLLTLAFSADVPSFLQHKGPYRYVRHPFYLSYLLFWVGTAIASGSLLHWTVPAAMGLLYVEAARREEVKFASSPLAPAYQAYRRHTGMLVPRIWRQPARPRNES